MEEAHESAGFPRQTTNVQAVIRKRVEATRARAAARVNVPVLPKIDTGTTAFFMQMPTSLHMDLKETAAHTRTPAKDIVIEALKDYFTKHAGKAYE